MWTGGPGKGSAAGKYSLLLCELGHIHLLAGLKLTKAELLGIKFRQAVASSLPPPLPLPSLLLLGLCF